MLTLASSVPKSDRHRMPKTVHALLLASALFAVPFSASRCTAPRPAAYESITVEGRVSARGSEPFAEYVLETADGRLYILELPESANDAFAAPAAVRVTGRLYPGQWESRTFAHIDVRTWESLP